MLAIRMKRTGRKGHAMFRVIVQDARLSPASGKVVAFIGTHDPHTKQTTLVKEKASYYLEHGAQPSERVARLLKSEGVKLPAWVVIEPKKKGSLRHPEKLRKNRPAGAPAPAPKEEAVAEESSTNETGNTKQESEQAETATEPAPAQGESSENTEAETKTPENEQPAAEKSASDETVDEETSAQK